MSVNQASTPQRGSGLPGYAIASRGNRIPSIPQSLLIRDRAAGALPDPVRRKPASVPPTSGVAGSRRCGKKGCVFPADANGAGVCRHHRREQREPAYFHSVQVTGLLLDAAKLGLPNCKRDAERQQDRRRLEAIRERFLEEIA